MFIQLLKFKLASLPCTALCLTDIPGFFGTFSNISITVLQHIAEGRGDTGQRWERSPEAVEGQIKL